MPEFTAALSKIDAYYTQAIGNTNEVSIQDTFQVLMDSAEDGDIAEYGGDTGQFSANNDSTIATDGSYYIRGSTDSTGANKMIASTSGLPNYFDQGQTAKVDVIANNSGSQPAYLYSLAGESAVTSGYSVKIDIDDNLLEFNKFGSGVGAMASIGSDATSEALSTGAVYTIKVKRTLNNDHHLTLYNSSGTEIASISATDSEYEGNSGIGYGVITGLASAVTADFDNARLV